MILCNATYWMCVPMPLSMLTKVALSQAIQKYPESFSHNKPVSHWQLTHRCNLLDARSAKLNLPHSVPPPDFYLTNQRPLRLYPWLNLLILDLTHQAQFHHLPNIVLNRMSDCIQCFSSPYVSVSIAPYGLLEITYFIIWCIYWVDFYVLSLKVFPFHVKLAAL